MFTLVADPERCGEVHAVVGQCQLLAPHDEKPHAASSADGVSLWNHIEVQHWTSYSMPNWVRRLPWQPGYKPPSQEVYF